MRVYVAGPMTQKPYANFPSFDLARDLLLELGHDPVSPADLDRAEGFEPTETPDTPPGFYEDAMRRDIAAILGCEAIGLLTGWEKSRGANIERSVAEAIGLPIYLINLTAKTFEIEQKPVVIGIGGYARSGKDTLGAALVNTARFSRVSFADALKQIARKASPVVANDRIAGVLRLDGVVEGHGWDGAKQHFPEIRLFLQHLGVGAREVLGADVWVDVVRKELKPGGRYVVTDVRFPNEFKMVKDLGGVMVRVNRPGTDAANAHVSETALDDHVFDYVVENSSTLVDLQKQAKVVAELVGPIPVAPVSPLAPIMYGYPSAA